MRKVVDFMVLNKYSNLWRCVFPGSLEVVRSIPKHWNVFTVADLAQGFFHFPVDEELQKLFGFEYNGQRFTYTSLPQGWLNSSTIFHSRVRSCLEELPVVQYVDDLLIGGSNMSDHQKNVETVFQRLQDIGFHVNPEKLQFGVSRVQFLGYDISPGTFSLQTYVNKQKSQLPTAVSKRELRKIIGIFNVVRPVCYNLANWIQPLLDALKNPHAMKLDEIQRMTKKVWSQILDSNMSLKLGNDFDEYHIFVDWSKEGWGYALFGGNIANGCLLGLNSHTEKICEDSSYLGELRGIVWALKQVQSFTAGKPIHLHTDSESAYKKIIHEVKVVDDVRIARLLAWVWENFPLGSYLIVHFIPGENNQIADMLSRWKKQTDAKKVVQVNSIRDEIWKVHYKGHYCPKIVLKILNDAGKTVSLGDVERELVNCRICALFGSPREKTEYGIIEEPSKPGEVISVDVLGPFDTYNPDAGSEVEEKYIFCFVDHLSRAVGLWGVPQISARMFLTVLNLWLNDYAVPRVLITDGATIFNTALLRRWFVAHNVKHVITPPTSHKSNGMVERAIRNVNDRFRRAIEHWGGHWTDYLDDVVDWKNHTPNMTTGLSPSEIIEGGPLFWREAKERTRQRRAKVNKGLYLLPYDFQVGDLVWCWNEPREFGNKGKLETKWDGPYRIAERLSKSVWKVNPRFDGDHDRNVDLIYHTDHMKKYY